MRRVYGRKVNTLIRGGLAGKNRNGRTGSTHAVMYG